MSKMLQICLIGWIMGITTVNTLRDRPGRPTELSTIDLVITAYQCLGDVYIDGQLKPVLTNARNWSLTDHVALSSLSRLIALEGVVSNGEPSCAGVLASVNDTYLLTSSSWKCSAYNAVDWTELGFDDSGWTNAVEYGSNGNHSTCTQQRHFDDISSNAKWIWSNDLNAMVVYCRGYLPLCQTESPCMNGGTCLPNHKKMCDCPPEFTGTYCDSTLEATEMTTGMMTSKETAHSETTESITTSNLQSTNPQASEETRFHQTTQEIFETLETTMMTTGMTTSEETTHSETTESITTSNFQSTEETTFPQTTQEILTTLETTKMTTGMTTSEQTTHSETTESITTSNPQATEVTTFPQTTQEILTTLEAMDMTTGMTTSEATAHPQTTESITTSNPQATEVTTFPQTTQELMEGVLIITAYQDMQLMYIDGIEQTLINGNMWNQTDRAGLTETNRLVAVKVLGDETCGGILASVGDTYFLTNTEWKCSPYNFGNWYILGFDDSQEYWFNAVEFGSNADGHTLCSHLQTIPDISANAMWIWVPDQTEKTIYCRGYMPVCDSSPCLNNGTCLQNNVKICSCLPQFTGTYCETDQAHRGFGRNNSRK